jgi:hypothetical protein
MLGNAAESPASSARFVRRHLWFKDTLIQGLGIRFSVFLPKIGNTLFNCFSVNLVCNQTPFPIARIYFMLFIEANPHAFHCFAMNI